MKTNLPSQLGINARDAAPNNNASSGPCAAEPKNDSGYSCPDRETPASSGQQAGEDRLSGQDQSSVRPQHPVAAPTNAKPSPEQQGAIPLTVANDGLENGSDGAARDHCKNGMLDLHRIQVIGALRLFRKNHGTPMAAVYLRDALIADAGLENYERKLREEKR